MKHLLISDYIFNTDLVILHYIDKLRNSLKWRYRIPETLVSYFDFWCLFCNFRITYNTFDKYTTNVIFGSKLVIRYIYIVLT